MILAIDPGGTTGLAWLSLSGEFGASEIPGDAAGFFSWWGVEGPVGVSHVVVESFIPRPGARSMQLGAIHIIGFLMGWCQAHGVPLTVQSPGKAKSFSTDGKLKSLGLWSRGLGHAVDATRHLVVWMCGSPEGRRLKGDEWLGVLSREL